MTKRVWKKMQTYGFEPACDLKIVYLSFKEHFISKQCLLNFRLSFQGDNIFCANLLCDCYKKRDLVDEFSTRHLEKES